MDLLFFPKIRSMWETSKRTYTLIARENNFKEALGANLKKRREPPNKWLHK
jgi:hypothetical protein